MENVVYIYINKHFSRKSFFSGSVIPKCSVIITVNPNMISAVTVLITPNVHPQPVFL